MGFLDRITGKARPVDQPVSGDAVLASTVTRGESSRSSASQNVTALSLMKLAAGLPAICAHITANDCSQVPLRLYAPKGRITIRGTKKVGRREQDRLRDWRRVGHKAAAYADQGGDVVEVVNHPALDLLSAPNPTMTGVGLRYLAFWFKAITGEAFEFVDDDGAVIPLYPHATNPTPADPGSGELVAFYAYGRERSDIQDIPTDQVIHYKARPHPSDPFHGYGPLHDCMDSARVLAENTAFDLDLIESGNVPAGVVSLDPKVYPTVDAVQQFMDAVNQQTRGRQGKSRLLAAAGATWQAIAGAGKELQTAERISLHESRVRQAFGIPETVLNNKSSAFASAEVGDDQYWAGTIRPMLCGDAEQRTEILRWFGVEPGEMWLAYDDPVLSDRQAEASIAVLEMNAGALSINEYRESVNLPQIEGGDVYRYNGVPLDQVGQQAQPPGLFTFAASEPRETKTSVPVVGTLDAKGTNNGTNNTAWDGTGGDAGDDRHGERIGSGEAAGSVGTVRVIRNLRADVVFLKLADRHAGADPYADCPACSGRRTKDDDKKPLGDMTAEEAADEAFPSILSPDTPQDMLVRAQLQNQVMGASVARFSEVIEDFIEDAKLEALQQVRRGQPIDLSGFEEKLQTVLEPEFREVFRSGFNLGGYELGEDEEIDPFNIPNAEAIAETQTSLVRQFSRDISDHTAQAIEGRIRAGIEAGDSIDDITKQIEADTGFSRARSERIARTEVQRAANNGKLARYKEAGVTTKYSVTAPGATAVHRAIEAKASDGIPIDEPFVRAGETIVGADGSRETYDRDMQAPPYRPNCRCSIQTRPNDRG